MIIFEKNLNIWKKYPDFYGYFSVFLVIFLFIISGLSGLSGFIHPKFLILVEFIKRIYLPSFLTSDTLLKWEFKGISSFFDHEIIYTQDEKNYNFKNTQYIKCLMPHGIVPFTIWCLWGDNVNAFNYVDNTFVTATQLYEFPFISHYAKACHSIPSNYSDMENALKQKKSLIVYKGGLREMFSCSHKKDVIMIKKRKGIFYMALKNGVSLLPIYTFGITSLYERSGITITLPFFFKNDTDSLSWYYGKYNTPFPLKKKLLTVVGSPIYVSKKNIITDKDINDLRNRYIIVIQNLYDKWSRYYNFRYGSCKDLFIE